VKFVPINSFTLTLLIIDKTPVKWKKKKQLSRQIDTCQNEYVTTLEIYGASGVSSDRFFENASPCKHFFQLVMNV
jgi:hypothetical protein